eukprot:jgi/Botrbrau1/8925/Bobra.0148s0038.1
MRAVYCSLCLATLSVKVCCFITGCRASKMGISISAAPQELLQLGRPHAGDEKIESASPSAETNSWRF